MLLIDSERSAARAAPTLRDDSGQDSGGGEQTAFEALGLMCLTLLAKRVRPSPASGFCVSRNPQEACLSRLAPGLSRVSCPASALMSPFAWTEVVRWGRRWGSWRMVAQRPRHPNVCSRRVSRAKLSAKSMQATVKSQVTPPPKTCIATPRTRTP